MAEWVINIKSHTPQTVSCMCVGNVDNELKINKKNKICKFLARWICP